MINYEDFSKLEIRIGTIRSAEPVPETDKLLKLTVDFGEGGLRTIVSGIADRYVDWKNLPGKQCPFVVNLETRTLRGVESQGMILAASSEDTLALLHPHIELPAGTKVN